jgi:hypothetical protein
MRTLAIMTIVVAALGSGACARRDSADRSEPAARQAGREAYQAGQDIKRGAKKAANELREAGKELKQGWNEAKHEDRREPRK